MSEITAPYPASDRQQEKSWTAVKILFTGLTGFCLLSFLWTLAIGAGINNMPTVIWIARIASVPLAVYLGKLWKNKGFWILALYTLLFFLRCFIPNPNSVFKEEVAENMLSALWLFTACYGLGRILNEKQLKSFLLLCAFIWTAGMTILNCIGVYAAWTGEPVTIFGSSFIGLYISDLVRLHIVYLATTSGSFIGISLLISVLLLFCTSSNTMRIVLSLSLFVSILALALTDSRTAYISVPAGLGVMVFSAVFHFYQTKNRNKWKPWIWGLIAMILVFIILIWLIMQITPIFNSLKDNGIIAHAFAEEVKTNTPSVVSTRGFGGHILSGRMELWSSVVEHIRQNPKILILGESKLSPLRGFDNFYAHCHCLYLQVLLESGIPGLFLFLSFIFYTLYHAIKVIRTPDLPLWIRLLPALPISLWVGDIAETFTWLRSSQCPMGAIALISAGIICAQTTNRNKQTET